MVVVQVGTMAASLLQLFLVCASIIPSLSFINLFLGSDETFLLLGLKSTNLYYIQDGKVNDYALGFQVPVAPNISALHFTWQNKDPRIEIPYLISLSVNEINVGALESPKINISREGNIPHELQIFRIRLPCTGHSNAEVDVNIYINLTMPLNHSTNLILKRKKFCLQGLTSSHEYKVSKSTEEEEVNPVMSGGINSGGINSGSGESKTSSGNSVVSVVDVGMARGGLEFESKMVGGGSRGINRAEDESKKLKDGNVSQATTNTSPSSPTPTHSLYIVVGTVSIFCLACALCFIKTNKSRNNNNCNSNLDYGSHLTGIKDGSQAYFRVENTGSMSRSMMNRTPSCGVGIDGFAIPQVVAPVGTLQSYYTGNKRFAPGSAASYMSLPRSVHIYCEPTSNRLEDQLTEISVERRNVLIQDKLLEGTFAQVYKGIFIRDPSTQINVMIKTVSDQCSKMQVSLFVAEGMTFFKSTHPNILPIISVCLENPEKPLLMYPLPSPGNLKHYLRTYKSSPEQDILTTQDLVQMAIQIVSGMIYLHKKSHLHKDLAARNCVIHKSPEEQGNVFMIKITDNSLSRDLFPDDYHCLGDSENRPIKWLSLESLTCKEFTPYSDIWSFGVTLWELMTLGQQPYLEVDPFEMAAYLQDGFRLCQPTNCPDKLYDAMVCCWFDSPEARPNFPQLLTYLQDFHTALGPFI